MTFTLKGYGHLKSKFLDVVQGYTNAKDRDPANILKITNENKKGHLSLAHTLIELLAIKQTSDEAVASIYGGMLVANEHARRKLTMLETEENSYVITGFKMCMGITDKPKVEPSHEQYAKCYKEFNKLLKSLIYEDGDSRKGLKTNHPFTQIDPVILTEFIKIGFELEASANDAVIKSLPSKATGKSKVSAKDYKFSTAIDITPGVVDHFKSFEELCGDLTSVKNAESHAHNSADLAKVVAQRKLQLATMEDVASALAECSISDNEKKAILAGTMYIIREEIRAEYFKTPFSKKSTISLIAAGSKMHTELSTILGLSPEKSGAGESKTPSFENIELMIRSAYHFMEFMAIEPAAERPATPVPAAAVVKPAAEAKKDKKDKKPVKVEPAAVKAKEPVKAEVVAEPTRLFREKTIFSPAYSFAKISPLVQSLLLACQKEALNACVKKVADSKPKDAKASTGGIFSRSYWLNARVASKVTDEDDVVAAAPAAAGSTAMV